MTDTINRLRRQARDALSLPKGSDRRTTVVVSGFSRTAVVVSGFSRTAVVVSGFSRTVDVQLVERPEQPRLARRHRHLVATPDRALPVRFGYPPLQIGGQDMV